MIFWYTGQPGHGKSLHAIDHALRLADEGRLVYVCNVRDFDHAKAGVLPMTPEQFRDWPNFLPDGAVAMVDEAYEHGMLPKRGPGTKVPPHVEQLAKHRHRGIDFIFVSQSPARQIDDFVHDLIEEHVHVRRRFGTKFVHLRKFDHFERNPLKAHPITLKRVRLPKRPMGLYVSTVLDTTEKKIPWYYFVAAILAVALPAGAIAIGFDVKAKLSGSAAPTTQAATDGAVAKAGAAPLIGGSMAELDAAEIVRRQTARIPGVPWSAPLWDDRRPQSDPQVFCIASEPGLDALGNRREHSCSCVTEQGTEYRVPLPICRTIARSGPMYNPYKAPQRSQETRQARDTGAGQRPAVDGPARAPPAVVGIGEPRPVGRYGGFRSPEGNVASW